MSRWTYFFKRVLLAIPVIFLVLTFMFVMLRMGPLDPVAARLGPEATGAEAAQMRERLGLNDPLWQQYLQFVQDMLLFDGQSWVVQGDRHVRDVIASAAPPTLWLGFWAILLPLFIGLPLGFYAGLNSNTWGDYIATTGGILWQGMPNFWLGVMLLEILRTTHGGGLLGFDWYTFGPEINSITGTPALDFFSTTTIGFLPVPTGLDLSAFGRDVKRILPPALILGSASMGAELRLGRTAILENINANYVETAKAKGLKNRTIVWKHMFRNALIPLVPVITNEAFILIGGSVILEVIFNINGIGRIFFLAITSGDVPLAGSLLFLLTVVIIGLNILQDFLYTVIDPRVGYER